MNPQAPPPDGDAPGSESALQRVRELLPLHAAGVLQGPELAFVEQWLQQHADASPDITAELAWLRTTVAQARTNASEAAPEAGLADLMARIDAERRPAPRPASAPAAPASWLAWLGELLAPRRPALALGVAAVVLAQAAVIGSLLTRAPAEQEPLAGGVAAPLGDSVVFSIAFRPEAREAELRALLGAAGAQVVAGPSALGLWRVAVPKARVDAALAAWQAAPALVESVQREP
jgi:hypothetical protein